MERIYTWEGQPTEGLAIQPTHEAFDDALDYLAVLVEADRTLVDSGSLFLVHAIALVPDGPNAGKPFSHAWVELGEKVCLGGLLDGVRVFYSVPLAEFYEKMRVQESTRYTVREAVAENYRTNHYGPWLEKYRALCRKE